MLLATACSNRASALRNKARTAASTPASELQGLASYYAEPYHGRRTASGDVFDTYQDMTAAHRTLPFNTVVKVTNEENGRNVQVRINDRGPFVEGRVIDLSLKAARELDIVRAGLAPVKLTVLKDGVDEPSVSSRPDAPSAASSSGSYTIQVGAFASQDAADLLKRDLEQRYSDVTVETVTSTRTLYRVRVGRLANPAAAEGLMNLLRKEDLDPFVVRLN
jgi:rare lipoprotein A